MNVTEAFLLVSLLLNLAFMLGVPITLFVRFLIRRTKWVIVGQGSGGLDYRLGRPTGGYYLWKLPGGRGALVAIQPDLVGQDREGRPVIYVDTDSMHQIAQTRFSPAELAALPEEYRKAVLELAQLPRYAGRALNDADKTEIIGIDGVKKTLKYIVWTRISGSRLYKAFKDIRVAQMNESNVGMWATLERLAPILSIVAIIMLIIVMVQLGNLG